MPDLTRRGLLGSAALLAAAPAFAAQAPARPADPFGYCLNTSTIRLPEGQWGKTRPIVESIAIAQKAGYSAIEPWVSELDDAVKAGTTPAELKKRFADAGLAVPDAIGFAEWVVSDPARRKKGLEQAKRDFDLIAQVGGLRMAAPPVGATGGGSKRDDPKASDPVIDLLTIAERYRDLLLLGKTMGVTPIVEVWGFSKTLHRLGETLMVAAECGQPGGAVLPDVYHLYKGGSDFAGLKLASGAALGIVHVNDYPAIERGKIADADRVYPGDGTAPLTEVYRTLQAVGYAGFLSLELFNAGYWKQDPLTVAKTGLDKLKTGVAKALAG